MRQPGEPSIEEILELIKRVIAREDRTPAFPARDEREEPGEQGLPSDDSALDLVRTDFAEVPPSEPARLVTDDASRAARSSLEALAGIVEQGGMPPRDPAPDNGPLEALLRDLLRPALSEWLDRNLPAIVERMVAVEIARITSRR